MSSTICGFGDDVGDKDVLGENVSVGGTGEEEIDGSYLLDVSEIIEL